MAIGVQTDCSTPALANFGSDKLKETFLAPAISGDMVTSIAVSEPGGGSDVGSITTTAERRGEDLVINGTKMWITSGMQSDWACLLANTEKEGGQILEQVPHSAAHGCQGHLQIPNQQDGHEGL